MHLISTQPEKIGATQGIPGSSSGILVISLLSRAEESMSEMHSTDAEDAGNSSRNRTFDWETWVAWTLHRSIWSWTSVPSLRQNLGLDAKSENLGTYFWGLAGMNMNWLGLLGLVFSLTMGHVEPR